MLKIVISIFSLSVCLSNAVQALIPVGSKGACENLVTVEPSGQKVTKNTCESKKSSPYVLIDFVSATCTYCIGSLPEIAQFTKEQEANLTIRQVGVDRNTSLLDKYWSEHQEYMIFDLAYDSERKMKRAYEVYGVPSYVLLDKDQNVVFSHEGTLDPENFEEIKAIIKSQN